jgi:hypothetical protein
LNNEYVASKIDFRTKKINTIRDFEKMHIQKVFVKLKRRKQVENSAVFAKFKRNKEETPSSNGVV